MDMYFDIMAGRGKRFLKPRSLNTWVRRSNRERHEEIKARYITKLDVQDYAHAVGIVMDEDTAYYYDGIRYNHFLLCCHPLGVMFACLRMEMVSIAYDGQVHCDRTCRADVDSL